jgi:hypothetical protein
MTRLLLNTDFCTKRAYHYTPPVSLVWYAQAQQLMKRRYELGNPKHKVNISGYRNVILQAKNRQNLQICHTRLVTKSNSKIYIYTSALFHFTRTEN